MLWADGSHLISGPFETNRTYTISSQCEFMKSGTNVRPPSHLRDQAGPEF